MTCAFIIFSLFYAIIQNEQCYGAMPMRLLLIEDDYQLNQSLKAQLMKEGYAVDVAFDGETGEDLARLTPYDVIIIDVMIPKKDGILVCRALRRAKLTTPILLLTARDTIQDRVSGLDSGADDYLIKPFSLHELFAGYARLCDAPALEHRKWGSFALVTCCSTLL